MRESLLHRASYARPDLDTAKPGQVELPVRETINSTNLCLRLHYSLYNFAVPSCPRKPALIFLQIHIIKYTNHRAALVAVRDKTPASEPYRATLTNAMYNQVLL